MKKSLISVLSLLVIVFACGKQEKGQGQDGPDYSEATGSVKIAVSIDQAADSPLKTTWDEEETISVITLDGANRWGNVVSVDNFTSKGKAGRKTAVFGGELAGDIDPACLFIVYPALAKSGDKYRIPSYNTTKNLSSLYDVAIGNDKVYNAYSEACQIANDNMDGIKDVCVMSGEVEGTAESLTATIHNRMALIKAEVQFNNLANNPISLGFVVCAYESNGTTVKKIFGTSNWHDAYTFFTEGFLEDDSASENVWAYPKFNVPSDGSVTLYIPVRFNRKGNLAGEKWKFIAHMGPTWEMTGWYTIPSDIQYKAGKVYTVSASLDL
ncbi:MAG: hypothetical protein IK045_03505 [Bacteroidales bacterium]|nr:hypothetical protein [Bacteroidales bacterium]